MRRWIGLGLLAALAVVLTACPAPPPTFYLLLYYPQDPSLCPGGVKMISIEGYDPPLVLQPTTIPPTPPAPEEVIPVDVMIEPPQRTPLISTLGGPEQFGFAFTCEAGEGWLTTPGPRLPLRENYVEGKGLKVLVVVEDPNEAGYLKWYWAYHR